MWIYILDDCDHAGVWTVDTEIASIKIGEEIDAEEAFSLFNSDEERVVKIDGGKKWFIPSFIEFQYGELKQNNRAHISVINILIHHGLESAVKYKYAHKIGSGISDKLKQRVFVRDNFTCIYCGMQYDPAFLSYDHVIPRADGGTHAENNIVTASTKCNKLKSDFSVAEFCERQGFDLSVISQRIKKATEEAPSEAPSVGAKDKEKDKAKDKGKGNVEIGVDGGFSEYVSLVRLSHPDFQRVPELAIIGSLRTQPDRSKWKPAIETMARHYAGVRLHKPCGTLENYLHGKASEAKNEIKPRPRREVKE